MISVDTLEDNKKFAEMHEADYPILSDVSKEIANKYGVLGARRVRAALDVLHRARRQDPPHRQRREAGVVGSRHGREAR